MTSDLQADCLTWNYRNAPPAHIQREIDEMSYPEPAYEEPKPTYQVRKPGIGQKKNYGYTVPDVISGKPTGEADGGVREAMSGWRREQVNSSSRHEHGVTFQDEQPDCSTFSLKENMFDLLAHTGLAENDRGRIAAAASSRITLKLAGPAKPPKDPRKNLAYVNRSNAIAEKYNKVEHKPWKMPKFENVPGAVSSFRGKDDNKKYNSETHYNPITDPDYMGIDGKSPSRESGCFVTERMEEQPAVGSDKFNPPVPLGETKDEQMFDI